MKPLFALALAAAIGAPALSTTVRAESLFFGPGILQFHFEGEPRDRDLPYRPRRYRERGVILEGPVDDPRLRSRAIVAPLTQREVARLLRMNGYSDVEIVSRRHLSFEIVAVDERDREVRLTVSRRDGAILSERFMGRDAPEPRVATPTKKRLPKVVAVPAKPARVKQSTEALAAPIEEEEARPRKRLPKVVTVEPRAPAPAPKAETPKKPRLAAPEEAPAAPAATAALPPQPALPVPAIPTPKPTPAPSIAAPTPKPAAPVTPPKPAAPATAAVAPKAEPTPVPPKPAAPKPAATTATAPAPATTPKAEVRSVAPATPDKDKDKPPVLLKKPGEKKNDDLVVF